MTGVICPYCYELTDTEVAHQDYEPKYKDECDKCKSKYQIEVEWEPEYYCSRLPEAKPNE